MVEKTFEKEWKVNSFRFTFFPCSGFEFDENQWLELIGTPPENVSFKYKSQIRHFDGIYDSGNFVVDTDPSRVHFVFVPNKEAHEITDSPLHLGDYEESASIFNTLLNKWFSLPGGPEVKRIAIGAQLFNPVSSRAQGYQKLQEYLQESVKIDIENSFDFSYSINRPRKTEFINKELIINRLTKWSVTRVQMQLQNTGVKDPLSSVVSEEFVVSLELDINTYEEYRGNFSLEEQKLMSQQLFALGKEISEKGDIK